MPRIARLVAVDLPHHITQRGNYRQNLFDNESDRQMYLSLFKDESLKYGLEVLAYCLMDNHVHFVAIPKNTDSMGNVFKYLNMKYSQYFNQKKGERGHLFQGRFFSSIMDENYMIACARYIERNPVRAGMINNPWEWKWSSAWAHCGLDGDDYFESKNFFNHTEKIRPADWKKFISHVDNPVEMAFIKRETLRGRPIASDAFIGTLEKRLHMRLRLLRRGRPKNK